KVHNKYKISEFIEITNGKLLDEVIDTNKLGEGKKEIYYLNEKNKKVKTYIEYTVIDDVPPIIIGGNTTTVKKDYSEPLEYIFVSADNYDRNPKREIIGEYDVNKVGQYTLTLKVTDSSNNVTTKDFVLNVVEKLPTYTSNTRTNYEDIFKKHKNENTKIGLDISEWQGNIDFDKLFENNVEFVILRVGYQKGFDGEYKIDPYFENNIKKLNELNIPVGVYFYTYATTTNEARKQALWVIDKIKDYNISLPVVFDFESWSYFPTLNLSLYDINEVARTFLNTIKENGYSAMNYSSKYFLEYIWDIDEYPVWLAHYIDQTNYKGEYVMWQLCDNGKIDGIKGNVDIDVLYDVNIIKKDYLNK
ncbi:MAG: hypothetical protein GX247_03600, partial [Mollicutes bacterium]|nr:hypothetical protein [Mollicutes bacterium]